METEAEAESGRESFRSRLANIIDGAEKVYLKLLRAMILIIATGLIVYAAVLAVVSLYKIAQSPDSVEEEVASVAPDELTNAELARPRTAAPSRGAATSPAHRRAYDQLLSQYHGLFRRRFEPFRQSEDQPLTRAQFNDRFFDTQARLDAIRRGDLNFESDIGDLRSLQQVMTAAADLPATRQRLQRYKSARKVQVCRNVERTRTTFAMGWNAYSTACPDWYENMGCAVRREVQTPYTARECSMRFPEGTQTHIQIFRAYQDKYFSLLTERRMANAANAETERAGIVEGITDGKLNLWTALMLVTGFFILMFFFLLIAIERHQRRRLAVGEQDD